jgi:hypothetical protein
VQGQPVTPFILELTDPATEEITVSDVLVGAFSFVGTVALAAAALALLFAVALIVVRRVRAPDSRLGLDIN